jgi:regulation of enolase protein 1 (concanavalin A-like superfamily)
MIAFALLRMLFQKLLERLAHHGLRRGACLRIAELGLRLAFELRIANFTEMTATSPSRTSSAVRFSSFSLSHPSARA